MATLAAVVIFFAVYAINQGNDNNINKQLGTLVPRGVFVGALIFGSALLVIALLGLCSATCDSKAGLALYILVVTGLFAGQLILCFYLLNKYNVIKDAATQAWSEKNLGPASEAVFDQLVGEVNSDAESKQTWVETQNALACCGYEDPHSVAAGERADKLAELCTGEMCLSGNGLKGAKQGAVYCHDKLLATAKKYNQHVLFTSGALALCQLFCIVAASRLACCVSEEDGGYAERKWNDKRSEHGMIRGRGNYEMRDRREAGRQLSYA